MNYLHTIEPRYQHRIIALCKKVNWDCSKISFFKDPVGGTNTSFFVSYCNIFYVFRIATETVDLLRIDRTAEATIMKIVSDEGIGTRLFYYNEQNGDMITYYESGHTPQIDELQQERNMESLIFQLKKLHNHSVAYSFTPIIDIEKRQKKIACYPYLNKRKNYSTALLHFNTVKHQYASFDPKFLGLCHNDPNIHNLILGERILLIDFEFSGMGNVFFDIACICGLWDTADQRLFLKKYFGYENNDILKTLKDYTFLQLIWNGTWAYMKCLDDNLIDIDYLGWADEQFANAICLTA